MRSVLDAIADIYVWVGPDGCEHPCCPSPCPNPAHAQGEIDWPPLEEQVEREEALLLEHLAGPVHRPGGECYSCRVFGAILADLRRVGEVVA